MTLPPAEATATSAGQQAVADFQRLLHDLGANPDVIRGVCLWADLGEREHVHVPSLPADLVARLVRLLPPAGTP